MKGKIHRQLHAFQIGKFVLVHYIKVKNITENVYILQNNDFTSENKPSKYNLIIKRM